MKSRMVPAFLDSTRINIRVREGSGLLLLLLFLFLVLGSRQGLAGSYVPPMSLEEQNRYILLHSFPVNAPLPAPLDELDATASCYASPVTVQFSKGGGAIKNYTMFSLMNCPENFLSPVRNQNHNGICMISSEIGSLESLTAIELYKRYPQNLYRHIGQNIFSPTTVNLSEVTYYSWDRLSTTYHKATVEELFSYFFFPGQDGYLPTCDPADPTKAETEYMNWLLFAVDHYTTKYQVSHAAACGAFADFENNANLNCVTKTTCDDKIACYANYYYWLARGCMADIVKTKPFPVVGFYPDDQPTKNDIDYGTYTPHIWPNCVMGMSGGDACLSNDDCPPNFSCDLRLELPVCVTDCPWGGTGAGNEAFGGRHPDGFGNWIPDTLQVNWQEIDRQIMDAIQKGHTVLITIPWNDKRDEAVNDLTIFAPGNLKIDFTIVRAKDKSNFEIKPGIKNDGFCNHRVSPPAFDKMQDCYWNLDPAALDVGGTPADPYRIYAFGMRGHQVLIVGYLVGPDENSDGRPDSLFYIIRNSWGDRSPDRTKDKYHLLPSPTYDHTTRYIFSFRPYGACPDNDHGGPFQNCVNLPRPEKVSEYWSMKKAYLEQITAWTDKTVFTGNDNLALSLDDSNPALVTMLDADGDNMPDLIDNCPVTENPDQADWDFDGFGDLCDICPLHYNVEKDYRYREYLDADHDGTPDLCDPCPIDPNISSWIDSSGNYLADFDHDEIADTCDNCREDANSIARNGSPYIELISAPREGSVFRGSGGAVALGYAIYTRGVANQPYAMWQPDHDLDGIGDTCDILGRTFVDRHGNTITADGYAYSEMLPPTPVDYLSTMLSRPSYFDVYVKVNQKSYTAGHKTSTHYCGVTKDLRSLWGKNGKCTTAYGSETKYTNKLAYDFGFSHGTDEMSIDQVFGRSPWDMRISWSLDEGSAAGDFAGDVNYTGDAPRSLIPLAINSGNERYWNWRRDWWERLLCGDAPNANYCQGLKTPLNGYIEAHNFYYTLSSGSYPDTTENRSYLKTERNTTIINSAYFFNQQKYARAHRVSTDPFTLNYHQKGGFSPNPPLDLPIMEYCPSCYIKVPIGVLPSETNVDPAPYDASRYMGQWLLHQSGSEVEFTVSGKLSAPANARAFFEGADHMLYMIVQSDNEYRFLSSYPGNDPDWHDLGALTGGDQMSQLIAVTQVENQFFIIGKDNSNATAPVERLYVLTSTQIGTTQQGDDTVPTFAYTLTTLGATGLDAYTGKRLISVGNTLYLLTRGDTVTTLRKLDPLSHAFTAIATVSAPSARKIYNIYGTENKLYLAGGLELNDDQPKDLWAFDTDTEEWTQLYNNLTGDLRKLVIEPIDGKLVMANPMLEFHQTVHSAIALNLTDETISYPSIPVIESPDYLLGLADATCLNETGSTLKGGTLIGGYCTPFTHPWYKQYSIGTTVYSVAGKGTRLYVGTGSSIKVYDISDPNALVLKSTFSTSSRIVYDLEVADGDIMYAATSKGLYKLSTANPDTLTIIGSFYSTGSYNYQYRIQLYNNLLYVGDDNGINIRHKDTFARLAYVNIGSTMDFAIANGELAMYWDDFWSSGIDIRDVDNLATRKAWDYPYCSTGELTTDHGAFYLSCDGYEYRFVGLPNTYLDFFELDGDMREMQENHLYNGWVYIPDGNKVKLSTSNNVPSICGNGIIEPGEFCDGNTEDCALLDPQQWDSGTAYCNSTCTAWDTGDCYWSGC